MPFKKIAKTFIKEIKPVENEVILASRVKKIGQLIDSVCRHTPWESKCLVQALICKRLCRKLKILTTLYIGVNKQPGSDLEAHAWVVDQNNNIIVGGLHSLQFKIIATYRDVMLGSSLRNRSPHPEE